jgi:integrase
MNTKKRNDLKTPSWQYDFRFDGKRYRKAGYKTKKEAEFAGHEKLNELQNPTIKLSEVKFKDYYMKWLKLNNKHKLSKGQYDWYLHSLDLFVDMFGEDKTVNSITRTDFRQLINEYSEGRSTESVRKLYQCLSACFKEAVYEGYIDRDPGHNLELKGTVPTKKEEEKYFTIKEYLDLLKHFDSRKDLSYILLYLVAITGARFSEINKMTWDDLNYGTHSIIVPGTKSETAYRVVEVDKEILIKVKSKLINHPRRVDGKVFNISYKAASNALERSREKLGIESYRTIHALRHTHCSYLLSKGVAIEYISKRLGHASIGITLNTYSHLLEEHRQEQAEKTMSLFK